MHNRAPVKRLTRKATVTTEAEAAELVDYYLRQEAFAFDVESVGTHRGTGALAQVTWLSMATHGRVDVIPLGHPHGELVKKAHTKREKYFDPNVLTEVTKVPKTQYRSVKIPAKWTPAPQQLRHSQWWEIAEPLFMSTDIVTVCHNSLYDLAAVAKYLPAKPAPPYDDTMFMARLIDENSLMGLKSLTEKGNRVPTTDPRHFPGYGHKYDKENVGRAVETHPFGKVARYAALDAQYTWWLWQDLWPILTQSKDVESVYLMEMDLYEYLLDMHLEGQPVNAEALGEISEVFTRDLHEAEKAVYAEAGKIFNLNSPVQMREVLFEDRDNEPIKFSDKTNEPSTDKEVLNELNDPLTDKILHFREFNKLVSSYLGETTETGEIEGGLLRFIVNGRIHTDLKPWGTVTGRFSSSDPNLQNIPRRGEHAHLMRKLFVAPPGYNLIVADYSQIEYRVLAHYSGDPTLIEAFENGYDPHAAVAAMLLNKDIEDVTDSERDLGKTFNFAQIYGAGNENLANTLGVSVNRIKQFRKKYDSDFPLVGKFSRYVVKKARSRKPTPYIQTLGGRRRHLPALLWSDNELRSSAERQAVNSLIQGSAADIIKFAMLDVGDGLKAYPDWRMLLTVHDELMLMAPEEEAPDCAAFLQETMEAVEAINVPLVAEAAYGSNWNEAK